MKKIEIILTIFFFTVTLTACKQETTDFIKDCSVNSECTTENVTTEQNPTDKMITYINQTVNEYSFDIDYSKTLVSYYNVGGTDQRIAIVLYEPEDSQSVYSTDEFTAMYLRFKGFIDSKEITYNLFQFEIRSFEHEDFHQIIGDASTMSLRIEYDMDKSTDEWTRTEDTKLFEETWSLRTHFYTSSVRYIFDDAILQFDYDTSEEDKLYLSVTDVEYLEDVAIYETFRIRFVHSIDIVFAD